MRKRATKAEIKLRADILKAHGLSRSERRRRARKQLSAQPSKPNPLLGKTLAMLLIERSFGQPIEKLLADGTQEEVAHKLGIKQPTVSVWKSRLGV